MMAGWWLIGALACVLLAAFFAALELALHTLSRVRMSAELDDEHPHRQRIETILDDVAGHAASLSVFTITCRLSAAVCFVFWASNMRHEEAPSVVSIILGLAVGAVLIWVGSVLVPMGVATHAGETALARLAPVARATHLVMVPFLPSQRFLAEVVRRLVGAEKNTRDLNISASDLRSIVDDDEVESRLDETERDMLEAVVEFRSTSVEQIMTPRTEIDALQYTDDLTEVMRFVDEHGHSRIPVYREDLDHIEGILYAKDLLRWITTHGQDGSPFVLSDVTREPTFVPETKTVRELLAQLLAAQVHIAIILDEYGGNSGLVTMEDIVEEIFGEIQDEYEDPEDPSGNIQLDPTTKAATIDARTEIDDANDELEAIGLELPESDDYDTVSGFVNTTLGRIPETGEEIDLPMMKIDILEAEPTRVVRVRITRVDVPDELNEFSTQNAK
ncbi:MAG: HlyC/CorC family transporter [Phycisphaerales bacterium]|nr:HlyC/CorC family transporter [Phycisphaerales bacterium]